MILAVRTVERVMVVGLEAVWVMVTVIFITVRMDEWRAMRSLLDNDLAIIATANAAHRHSPYSVRPIIERPSSCFHHTSAFASHPHRRQAASL